MGVEVAGGAAPKIVQAKPVNLEVYGWDRGRVRQLGTGYKTVEKADNRIEARADIAYGGNVRVSSRGSLEREGRGAFTRKAGRSYGKCAGRL